MLGGIIPMVFVTHSGFFLPLASGTLWTTSGQYSTPHETHRYYPMRKQPHWEEKRHENQTGPVDSVGDSSCEEFQHLVTEKERKREREKEREKRKRERERERCLSREL